MHIVVQSKRRRTKQGNNVLYQGGMNGKRESISCEMMFKTTEAAVMRRKQNLNWVNVNVHRLLHALINAMCSITLNLRPLSASSLSLRIAREREKWVARLRRRSTH